MLDPTISEWAVGIGGKKGIEVVVAGAGVADAGVGGAGA